MSRIVLRLDVLVLHWQKQMFLCRLQEVFAVIHRARFYNTSSDFVYIELRGRIIGKKLVPGERLPEVKIASDMGVSRTPVREALRRLAAEGLVRIVPNSGARVAAPTAKEMENAYAVREYLETFSVRLACTNGLDSRTSERIEEVLASEEEAFKARDLDAYLEVNNTFHRMLADASKNVILREYVENIILRTNVYILFYDSFDEDINYSTEEHRGILRAISDKDADRAERLMREHLRHSHRALAVPEKKRAAAASVKDKTYAH